MWAFNPQSVRRHKSLWRLIIDEDVSEMSSFEAEMLAGLWILVGIFISVDRITERGRRSDCCCSCSDNLANFEALNI